MKNDGFISFCVKAIILLAILLAVDKAVGAAFEIMKDVGLKTNPECMWLKTPYVVEKVDSEVIIVGSSRATHHYVPSIIEDSLGLKVYNCGQDGCFFLYQNCIINMILDRYKPEKIIWDIQPGCLNLLGSEREYQNVRYLSPYYRDNIWVTEFVNSEEKMSFIKMKSNMFAYNSKLLNSLFPLVIKGSTTEQGYIPLPSEGYKYPKLNLSDVNDSRYQVNEAKLSLFASTLERCNSEDVELLIIASPSYLNQDDAYRTAVSDLKKVAAEYGNEVYDYGDYYLDDPSKFKDSSHMNHKGAETFTRMIINKHLSSR